MTRPTRALLATALFGVTAAALPAAASAAMTMPLAEDYLISDTGFISNANGGSGFRVGANSTELRNVVFAFQLPNLGAITDPFASASLTSELFGLDTTPSLTYDADVYGLTSTTAALAVDPAPAGLVAYEGVLDPSANFERIIASYYTPTSSLIDPITASGTLASYLNDRYDGGAGAGEFVYLRLSPNAAATLSTGYFVLGQEDATWDDVLPVVATFITYTAIPEPASALLVAASGLALLARRRAA